MTPSTVRARHRVLLGAGDSTERMEYFSDAVFAIAMTLLILDLKVPVVAPSELGPALLDQTSELFAYLLSFGVIGINWASHHRRFRVISGFNRRLVRLNLLLLAIVAFVPYPTSVFSRYGDVTPAVVLYAATVAAMSVVQCLLWVEARRSGRLSPSIDRGLYRFVWRNILVSGVVFGGSIVIALAGQPLAAIYSWLLVVPLSFAADRVGRARVDDLQPAVGVAGEPRLPG